MNELSYMTALASEVKKHKNLRLQKLREWCEKLTKETNCCGGDTLTQENQAAVTASALLMEAHFAEEMDCSPPPHVSYTLFVRNDPRILQFVMEPHLSEGYILVMPSLLDAQSNTRDESWASESLKLPTHAGLVAMFSDQGGQKTTS